MENTGKVFFGDDSPQWYIAEGDRWSGPLSASDVYQKVLKQEISWAHFVWKPGQPDWKRICDIETFQAAVPALPGKMMQKEVKSEASRPNIESSRAASPASKAASAGKAAVKPAVKSTARAGAGAPPPPAAEKKWFLYYNESQFGPFSNEEIDRFLRIGKIHGRVHIWSDGRAGWERIEAIDEFKEAVDEGKKARNAKKAAPTPPSAKESSKSQPKKDVMDQRGAPRLPLVAKIMMAHSDSVIVAMCRDISVGGMQVLTDQIPGKPGDRIKLNVSPSGPPKKGEKPIEPFVAEGVIVRILEDGRGFSFRFDRLPDTSKKAIERYIQET